MDGLEFVRALPANDPMPMARHFGFTIQSAEYGKIVATAVPDAGHENPFRVVQGGFAASVLDIVLGLVSISVLSGDASAVSTTDLSVRYIRSIREDSGEFTIRGSVIHAGRTTVVAEARLEDAQGRLCATSQSTSLILREQR